MAAHTEPDARKALADLGAATQAELAATAGIAPRYAREWLEQQATAGYLACDDPSRPAEQRRYRLPAGHAEVLLDADSPSHAAPVAGMLAGVARVLPRLLQAYRTGDGVTSAAYGRQMRRGIAAVNRPLFLHELASSWLPALPDLDRRLRAARALLAHGGSVLIADERVGDTFTAPGDPLERFMYGWNILHCLPATLAEHPVEASGTVLRAPTVARWAAAAGFGGFEVLPIDNPFWRFYRIRR